MRINRRRCSANSILFPGLLFLGLLGQGGDCERHLNIVSPSSISAWANSIFPKLKKRVKNTVLDKGQCRPMSRKLISFCEIVS